MTEPLDSESLSFALDFITGGEGRKPIAEPFGFDASNFVLQQEDTRMGLDVSFASGEIDLEFYNKTFANGLTHEFTLIQEYWRRYGFEAQIKFIVIESGVDYIIGDLDFEEGTTNQKEVFKSKIIQENEQAIIKRRSEIEVDLFSAKDLDENEIDPVSYENLLIQAKPRTLENTYLLASEEDVLFRGSSSLIGKGNSYKQISKSEIQIVNSPQFIQPQNFFQSDRSHLILAQRGITKIKVIVKDVQVRYLVRDTRNISDYPLFFGVEKGLSASERTVETPENRIQINQDLVFTGTETIATYTMNVYEGVLNFELDLNLELVAGERLWALFDFANFLPSPIDVGDSDILEFVQSEGSITVRGTETDLNSITRSIRLIDAMKQVCKSIGGFNVVAPRFDVGGEFYENRIFDGNLLRGFEDKPFYVTFEDIKNQLNEVKGDYVVQTNGDIFFGIEEDFYPDNEILSFDAPSGSLGKSFNPRNMINKFTFKYKDFEEDRDEAGTLQSVHTNTQWLVPNTQVENEKEIEIPFIRDPFLLESTRVQSIEVKEDTALSQDNKKFILDTLEQIEPFVFTEVVVVNHSVQDGNIKLLNDSTFSWLRIGIQETSGYTHFRLNNINVENYRVIEVKDTLLTLEPQNVLVSPQQGQFSTSFTYSVLGASVKNRTNEGFDLIENVVNANGYSNLNYTIKRNVLEYWGAYLNTCCHFRRDKTIQNTFFKNNKELTTRKTGETISIVEGDDIPVIDLKDRILTPNYYKTEIRSNFGTVDTLIKGIRDQRGYISIRDNNNEMVKIHVSKLDYSWQDQLLMIEGEERYQVVDFLTITCENNVIKILQVGYPEIVTNQIVVNIEGQNVLIYDREMLLLTNPIRFTNISVNGVIGTTASEAKDLLDNIC